MNHVCWKYGQHFNKRAVSCLLKFLAVWSYGTHGSVCSARMHNKQCSTFVNFQNGISHASMLENSLQWFCTQYISLRLLKFMNMRNTGKNKYITLACADSSGFQFLSSLSWTFSQSHTSLGDFSTVLVYTLLFRFPVALSEKTFPPLCSSLVLLVPLLLKHVLIN